MIPEVGILLEMASSESRLQSQDDTRPGEMRDFAVVNFTLIEHDSEHNSVDASLGGATVSNSILLNCGNVEVKLDQNIASVPKTP